MAARLPQGLLDLLDRPSPCFVTTLMPDGSPQTTQTWVTTDGEHVVLNLKADTQKVRNLARDTRVTVAVADPDLPQRYYAVRGRVSSSTELGAADSIDIISIKYTGRPYAEFRGTTDDRLLVTVAADSVHSPTYGSPSGSDGSPTRDDSTPGDSAPGDSATGGTAISTSDFHEAASTVTVDEDLLADLGRVAWAAARLRSRTHDVLVEVRGADPEPSRWPWIGPSLAEDVRELGSLTDGTPLGQWCRTTAANAVSAHDAVVHEVVHGESLDDGSGVPRPPQRPAYGRDELLEAAGRLVNAAATMPARATGEGLPTF